MLNEISMKEKKPSMKFKLDAVLNLSSKDFSQEETPVLARGFKFRPTLEKLPTKDIILATEKFFKIAGISDDTATKIRNMTIKEIGHMQDLAREKKTYHKEFIAKRMEGSEIHLCRNSKTDSSSG